LAATRLLPRVGLPLVLLSILVGCASSPITKSVVAANLAQEEASNQLLLLNIARAYQRMPMHFSQIGQIRSGPGGWSLGVPSIGLELPFGGAAEAKYGLTLGAEGQTPVDVTPHNSQEFMRGMTKPIEPDQVAYFARQGWPASMLLHLFVESIEIATPDGVVTDRLVNHPYGTGFDRFRAFVRAASTCDLIADQDPNTTFYSSPVKEVGLKEGAKAKAAGLVLIGVDGKGASIQKKGDEPTLYRLGVVSKSAAIRWVAPPKTLDSVAVSTGSPNAAAPNDETRCMTGPLISKSGRFDLASPGEDFAAKLSKGFTSIQMMLSKSLLPTAPLNARSTPRDKKDDAFNVSFVTRSPQGMIYYLGELSRAQNATWATPHERPLTVELPDRSKAILFQMKNEPVVSGVAAVAVDYRGETFWVPTYKSSGQGLGDAQDRSVMTLALLTLIIGLQDKGTEAPTVSNVRVLR